MSEREGAECDGCLDPAHRHWEAEHNPEIDALATEVGIAVCAGSDEHSAGRGWHDARRYGPCGDHARITAEVVAELDRQGYIDLSSRPRLDARGGVMTRHFEPNPDQPDRCPSTDPWDSGLQCTRRIHEDDQCHSGGIAWKKDAPRVLSHSEEVQEAWWQGFKEARETVARQTDLKLVHFERPSDFRKGVLTCLAALDARMSTRPAVDGGES